MGLIYRSLVRDTLLPSEPAVVARAALDALAPLHAELPGWFGEDVERDGDWLTQQLTGEGPWWHVYRAMVRACDKPHTGLMDAAGGAALGALMSGRRQAGPGFALWRQPGGRLAVADVDPNGSGRVSGLLPGDLVEAIGGLPPRPSGLDVLQFHAAPVGRTFALQVDRFGQRLDVELEIRPGDVPVVTRRSLPGAVGYLNIRWYAASDDEATDTAASARVALSELIAQGVAGVVVDTRSGMGGNGKGVVGTLSAVCDAPVPAVFLNEEGEPVEVARQGERIWPDLPIAVLVNEQTASAAEMLAVGLEELAGAVLVGTPTSGSLNTLRFVELADGYRLALPDTACLGPRSRLPRPGHRLEPSIPVPNPTAADIAAGVDGVLEAARRWVVGEA